MKVVMQELLGCEMTKRAGHGRDSHNSILAGSRRMYKSNTVRDEQKKIREIINIIIT